MAFSFQEKCLFLSTSSKRAFVLHRYFHRTLSYVRSSRCNLHDMAECGKLFITSLSLPTLMLKDTHAQLFRYTSGRWLRSDRRQRDHRTVEFNHDALCRRILQIFTDASSIRFLGKKEGGFSKVLLFATDTGQKILARLPTRVLGPRRLTTNSEVATIQYCTLGGSLLERRCYTIYCTVQSKTTIPIPKTLDWSDDSHNPVGHEYTSVEHCRGIQLSEMSTDPSSSAQIRCIESVTRYIQQMTDLEFPACGSLYLGNSSALINVPSTAMDELFAVGPHCGARYWDCNVDDTRYYDSYQPNRGPCKLSTLL